MATTSNNNRQTEEARIQEAAKQAVINASPEHRRAVCVHRFAEIPKTPDFLKLDEPPGWFHSPDEPANSECKTLAPAEVAKYEAAVKALKEQKAEAERQQGEAQRQAAAAQAAAQAEAQRQQQLGRLWRDFLQTPAGDYAQRFVTQTEQEANLAMGMPYSPYLGYSRADFDANNQELVRRAQQAKADLQGLLQ
jgi:hypothetical protein